jgi:hypothetical protein
VTWHDFDKAHLVRKIKFAPSTRRALCVQITFDPVLLKDFCEQSFTGSFLPLELFNSHGIPTVFCNSHLILEK